MHLLLNFTLFFIHQRDVDMDSVPEEELSNMNSQLGALMAEFLSRQKRKKKGAIENLPKDEKSLMHFRTR